MTPGRKQNERGAAFAEVVIVLPLLFGIIFLLISYGVMLSFRQTMSQAAVEGARAAAVAPLTSSGTQPDRVSIARTTVSDSFLGQIGGNLTCSSGGTLSPVSGSVCSVTTESCPNDLTYQCIKVDLQYPYRANPRVILSDYFGPILPATLSYTARARIN
jgi:Flp pilus assembly protein TadG